MKAIAKWKDFMKTLDLAGLTEKDVQIVREIVEALKTRTAEQKAKQVDEQGIEFHSWPLGLKGINHPQENL